MDTVYSIHYVDLMFNVCNNKVLLLHFFRAQQSPPKAWSPDADHQGKAVKVYISWSNTPRKLCRFLE